MPGIGLIGRVVLAAMTVLALAAKAHAQQKPPTEEELKAKGARQMAAAEIRSTHVGNTLYHLNLRNGVVFPIFFHSEQSRSVKMGDGTRRATLWWIEGDRRCDESVTRQGIVCSRIYRFEGQMRACVEGEAACHWVVREVPGNPEGL